MKIQMIAVMALAAGLMGSPDVMGAAGGWIWQAEKGPADTWVCFRKTFNLDAVPASVPAKIAVDSKYWLWINGRMVVFEGGLKRGPTPTDTYYDAIDLAPHLSAGKNTIAILVWYWGKSGFSHLDSGQGGLWFEADLGGSILGSDASWKMRVHPAYQRLPVVKGANPNYRLSEHNVAFDARADVPGWMNGEFDDSAWTAAVAKGTPPAAPWNKLWKRPIPMWKDYGLKDYANAAEIPAESTGGVVAARLPYNAQITPYLKIDAPAGLKIGIRTDHYNPGDTSVRAEYITRAGVQEYESLGWMNGHHVLYDIPKGVKILSLKFRETGYDTAFSGSFRCNDAFYDRLWSMSQRTLYITMRDTFMDCPDRERAQWWGDAVNELGETFYALDTRSHLLTKKAIRDLVLWQKPNKVLLSPVPGNYDAELPPQMLASVGWYGFWTYYQYTGDSEAIVEAYPHVRDYLSLWNFGKDGLVVHRKGGWDWADWGKNIDAPVLDNAWMYLALKAAVEMAKLSGNDADIPGYRQKMVSIRANFDVAFWNGSAYRSRAHKGAIDDRANAMAVVAELAGKGKYDAVRKVLAEQRHASPYMEKYVLESLFRMGEADGALQRMKLRYREMVNSGRSTLPEHWRPQDGTLNHAWSGGPLTLLSQYAAGIAPTSPGFATYHVRPQMGSLTSIETSLTSVKGQITMSIQKSDAGMTLTLESPAQTVAMVAIPHDGKAFKSIECNGTLLWTKEGAGKGLEGVGFVGRDDGYMRFKVAPGTWRFNALWDRP